MVRARCSTAPQADTSIPTQLSDIHPIYRGAASLIRARDDVILDGKTDSRSGNGTDIDQLLERKREKNDYQLLIDLVEEGLGRPCHYRASKIHFYLFGIVPNA